MAATTKITINTNPETKQEANLEIPNAVTLAAIEEAEKSIDDPNRVSYNSVEELMAALNED